MKKDKNATIKKVKYLVATFLKLSFLTLHFIFVRELSSIECLQSLKSFDDLCSAGGESASFILI